MKFPARHPGSRPRSGALHVTAAVLSLLLGLLAAGCGGDGPDDDHPVLVDVTAEPAGVAPGGRTLLLWRFRIADDWHLYWAGRNDTGFPPEIKLDLPTGWIAGGLQWPAPERHLAAGDILDHVFYNEVVLVQQLAAPQDASPGSVLETTAAVRWLACKDSCVPGKAEVPLRVPVASQPPAPTARRGAAVDHLPRPLPDDVVQADWDGPILRVRALDAGVRRMAFMPTDDCGDLVDLPGDGAGAYLALRFQVRRGVAGPARGLLVLTGEDGRSDAYVFSHPPTQVDDDNPGG
jgi:hypothetical protein